jgi:hypothetical protein
MWRMSSNQALIFVAAMVMAFSLLLALLALWMG